MRSRRYQLYQLLRQTYSYIDTCIASLVGSVWRMYGKFDVAQDLKRLIPLANQTSLGTLAFNTIFRFSESVLALRKVKMSC